MKRGAWGLGLGAWGLLGLVLSVGCLGEDEASERRAALSEALVQEGVDPKEAIATVEGQPISAEVLARRVDQTRDGRTKAALLDELIMAEALYKEALAKGYGDSDEIKTVGKQAMAARLLSIEVESRALPSGVPEVEVEAYYKSHELEFYFTPELRSADHLLVMPTSRKWDIRKDMDKIPESVFEQSEAFAKQIHADIVENNLAAKSADDFKAIRERWAQRVPEDLEIDVETLPPFPKRETGKMGEPGFIPTVVEPFADAVFGTAVGGLSAPTRTIFGTHIASTTRIVEEQRIELSSAEAGIREHLANQKRSLLARALMERLLGEYGERVALNHDLLGKLSEEERP